MHLGRRPEETTDTDLQAFYERLFQVLAREEVHTGRWQLAECRAAWEGNPTWDNFVVMGWENDSEHRLLAVVNYGPTRAQCYARLPFEAETGPILLRDLLSDASYLRDGADLAAWGLYLDLPPWGRHVFSVESSFSARD
jgi:hypothetical protein